MNIFDPNTAFQTSIKTDPIEGPTIDQTEYSTIRYGVWEDQGDVITSAFDFSKNFGTFLVQISGPTKKGVAIYFYDGTSVFLLSSAPSSMFGGGGADGCISLIVDNGQLGINQRLGEPVEIAITRLGVAFQS